MADTTTLNKSVSALSNLEHFYSRRRTASVTIVAYTIQQSFLLGSSVVASALLRFYTPGTINEHPFFPRDNQTYAFNGLYALALVLLVSYVLGAEFIIPIVRKHPTSKKTIATILVTFVPISFLLGGVSASIHYNVPLMYISFAGFLGLALAIHDVVTRLETMQWWAGKSAFVLSDRLNPCVQCTNKSYNHLSFIFICCTTNAHFPVDGKKNVGVGIIGLTSGCSSIFYTLVTAWILNYSKSLATTLYTLFGIQVLVSGWIVFAIQTGKMDSPPKPDDVKKWIDESKEQEETAFQALENDETEATEAEEQQEEERQLSSLLDDTQSTLQESYQGGDSTSRSPLLPQGLSSEPSMVRPFGTTASIPVVLKTRIECLKYPMFYANALTSALFGLNGYATKVLLSSMFELVFNLPLMTSAYLSALSLLLFVFARGIFPYFFLDSKWSASEMSIVASLLSCIMYGILPTVIGNPSSEGGFSWNLFGFVIVKSFVGACFACLSSVKSAVTIDVIGVANIRMISSYSWDVAGVGCALGPMLAFTIMMSRYYSGMNYAEAISLFFYIASGIAFVNAGLYVILHYAIKKN